MNKKRLNKYQPVGISTYRLVCNAGIRSIRRDRNASTAPQKIVNGVDCDALNATIDAVKKDPGLAAFEFRIENEWVNGGLNRSTVSDFHGTRQELVHEKPFVLYNDEHPALLSADEGPNPV